MAYFQNLLVQYEGIEDLEDEVEVNEAEQLLMDMEIEDYSFDQYFTEFGEVDGTHDSSEPLQDALEDALRRTTINVP
jgi:hypothetical protein